MEEILASIRRIIAEGEREAQEGGGSDRTQAASTETAQPEAGPEPTLEASVQAEVLVLTEMVQDDGSVVSLPPAPADAPPGETDRDDSSAPTEPADAPLATPPRSPEPAEAELVPPWMRAEPMSTVAAAPADTPDPTTADLPATTTTPSPDKERIAVPAEGFKKPELVSEEALAASTAALSQLAQSVSRTREPTPGQSKTVDELVREAVEPMLKTWLDTNLPRIVERMVREAIDRVVRRVE
jgi:hypothetical protein